MRFKIAHIVLIVGVLATASYINTLENEPVFDDLSIILNNPLVTDHDTSISEVFGSHYWEHVTGGGNLHRPITILTYRLNHLVAGSSPVGYHIANIALHAICSLLVTLIPLRLNLSPGIALATGALFATHPIHAEAVAGLVGRAELLAAVGVLGAWAIHMRASAFSFGRAVSVLALFWCGLLSKENAVVFPALALAGDFLAIGRDREAWRARLPLHAVYMTSTLAWVIARRVLLPEVPAGDPTESVFTGISATERLPTALSVITRYVWLLLFPVKLSADYSYAQIPEVPTLLAPMALVGLLTLTALVVIAMFTLVPARGVSEKLRCLGLCAVFFLITIAPVSNILVPIGTIMGERLLYLPSFAFCLGVPIFWKMMAGSRRAWSRTGALLAVALTIAYGARTMARNTDWRNQLTLFTATVETSPRSAKAWYNLGVALEEHGRPEDALDAYAAALRIKPVDARSHHNTGLILASMGLLDEAARHLERALDLDPDLTGVRSNLGVVYVRLDRMAEAEAILREALRREPDEHDPLYNLGSLLLASGREREAVDLLRQAARIDPEDADGRYQLGLALRLSGNARESLEHFEAALAKLPQMKEAHLQIALARLQLGDRERAAASAAIARDAGLALPPSLADLLTPRNE